MLVDLTIPDPLEALNHTGDTMWREHKFAVAVCRI